MNGSRDANGDSVTWVLELDINDGQDEAFRTFVSDMVAATQANEPGTLIYEWSLREDGRHCHVHERYANSDAAMIHLRTFAEHYQSRFFSIFTPVRCLLYGAPTDEVRGILAGLNTQYLAPAGGLAR